jgi:hypothetical protein
MARRLPGLEHREREAGLGEVLRLDVGSFGEHPRRALEHAAAAERVVPHPRRVAGVDHEPARAHGREPGADVF